ncbi:MAG: ATP-binding protein [Tahibacter sp.]
MRIFSVEGKLALVLALLTAGAAVLGVVLTSLVHTRLLAALLVATVIAAVVPLVARGLMRQSASLFRALTSSVSSFRDGDFSVSIATTRRDEIGDLVRAHNELGRVLRDQRQSLFQRELLLDTVVQHTPTALVLTDPSGHVVYANASARQLLNGGRRLLGLDFTAVVRDCPKAFAQAVESGGDMLFGVTIEGEDETFHFSQRRFKLQGRAHDLYQIRRLTRELSRQEVATWKKVIRVISHELNNSLAPISSLAHSGRVLAQKGDFARLTPVFDTIEERTRHLHGFIHGYAEFAKLPQPRQERINAAEFLEALARQFTSLKIHCAADTLVWFDRAQIEQVAINLLKNAQESGSPSDSVEIGLVTRDGECRIEVLDRGGGMSETVLANALLPFYSTKRSGTGLGLALAREIVEAHGGRITLANREGGGLRVSLHLPQPQAGS